MSDERTGYLQLTIYSILAGIVGVFVKLTHGMNLNLIIFVRALLATLFILILVIISKRLNELRPVHPFRTLLVGAFQGLSIFFYLSAVLKTSISNAAFLLYTAPVFSVILAKYFLKERIERKTILGIVLTLAGIIIVLNPNTFSFSSTETLGNIFGLLGGFFYSAMAITAKPLMKKVSGFYMVFWQYLVISIMFTIFFRVGDISAIYANWWQLLTIGVLCTGIAFVLFMEGVRKVKAQQIFIVTALEPLAGSVLALVVLKQIPSIFTIAGGILITYGVWRTTRITH